MKNGNKVLNALGLVYKVKELGSTQESIRVGIDDIEVCFPLTWWDSCESVGASETTPIMLTRKEIEGLIDSLDDSIHHNMQSGCSSEYEHQIPCYTRLMEKLILAKAGDYNA